jgi:hypothetical protein
MLVEELPQIGTRTHSLTIHRFSYVELKSVELCFVSHLPK